MQVSVIIVNYNVRYFLEQALYAVQAAGALVQTEIIVIDNASTDGSREYLSGKFPEVKFIWSTQNLGFGKANNEALQYATGEFVLFLNPDTIIAEESLLKCYNHFSQNEKCGALGVHMIDGSGHFLPESKRGLPFVKASFFKMVGLSKLFPENRSFSSYYAAHVAENKTAPVEVLSGAFMMMRMPLAKKLEGFDEDYFMYGEDIDLSYRIVKSGWENHYLAETTILHFKGESTSKQSADYRKHFYGAMKLFVQKHYKKPGATVLKWLINAARHSSTLLSGSNKDQSVLNSTTKAVIVCCTYDEQKVLTDFCQQISPGSAIDFFNNKEAIMDMFAVSKELYAFQIPTLVMSSSVISYEEMIAIMKKYSGYFSFFIHSRQSGSVVGSTHKNTTGFALGFTQ